MRDEGYRNIEIASLLGISYQSVYCRIGKDPTHLRKKRAEVEFVTDPDFKLPDETEKKRNVQKPLLRRSDIMSKAQNTQEHKSKGGEPKNSIPEKPKQMTRKSLLVEYSKTYTAADFKIEVGVGVLDFVKVYKGDETLTIRKSSISEFGAIVSELVGHINEDEKPPVQEDTTKIEEAMEQMLLCKPVDWNNSENNAPDTKPNKSKRRIYTDEQIREAIKYCIDNPNIKRTKVGKYFGINHHTLNKVMLKYMDAVKKSVENDSNFVEAVRMRQSKKYSAQEIKRRTGFSISDVHNRLQEIFKELNI
jgi:hypothetical protein